MTIRFSCLDEINPQNILELEQIMRPKLIEINLKIKKTSVIKLDTSIEIEFEMESNT